MNINLGKASVWTFGLLLLFIILSINFYATKAQKKILKMKQIKGNQFQNDLNNSLKNEQDE